VTSKIRHKLELQKRIPETVDELFGLFDNPTESMDLIISSLKDLINLVEKASHCAVLIVDDSAITNYHLK
jgi:hypothetical protein